LTGETGLLLFLIDNRYERGGRPYSHDGVGFKTTSGGPSEPLKAV